MPIPTKFPLYACLLVLPLAGCAPGGVSVAGLYSSAHNVEVNGTKVPWDGYIDIDRAGKITAYTERKTPSGDPCYVLASGTETNALLQGRTLVLGTAPNGEPAYRAYPGNDTFGVFAEPGKNGEFRWFFHAGLPNSTVTIIGDRNVVNSGIQSYSITSPRLTSPTLSQLQATACKQGTFQDVLDNLGKPRPPSP